MDTSQELMLLTVLAVILLTGLSLFGEYLRGRGGGPVVETFMTRVQSWWAMVILVSLALQLGRGGVVVLFAFASFAALRELLTLTQKSTADHLSLALGFFVILPLQYLWVWLGYPGLIAVFVPVYAFLLLPIVSALRRDTDRFLMRMAETQWALMLAVFCISHVPALLTLDIAGYAGREVLLIAFLVVVVQIGDLLDFFFGRRIGTRKIAEGVSPKTWEGVICGVGSAMLLGAALSFLTPFGIAGAALLAGAASLTGMFGSIVLAAIKRDRGVKDWSHLIPGQGGFVEQLDSVFFAAPIFYHLTKTFWT